MRLHRSLVAVSVSVALHVVLAGVMVGVAVWKGWRFTQTVDFELVSTKTEEVKALPLGPPPPPPGAAEVKRGGKRPKMARNDGVKVTTADAGQSDAGGADAGIGDAGRPDAEATDARLPAPRDLRDYGPEGSRLTALLRFDRLRTVPQAPRLIEAIDALLRHLPDRRHLLEGTGLDLYADFDALLVATPNPLDPAVTFLAAHHHLDEGKLMTALARGAETAGRPLAWRREAGRPVGVRNARGPDALPTRIDRDDRLIVLPQPGLAIMAPAAHAKLLLPGATDSGAAAEEKTAARWRELVARIDAEGGTMPDDAVMMMTATHLLSTPRGRREGAPPLAAPDGLSLPQVVNLVASAGDSVVFETTAEFAKVAEARAWEERWPAFKQQLMASPLLLLSGFSSFVARAELHRDERSVVLRTTASPEETRRLLLTIANLLGPAPP